MKKSLTFSFFTFFLLPFFLGKAQSPIINKSNFFDIGDSVFLFEKYDNSLSNFTVGPSGANVLWDFSALDFNDPSVIADTIFYISPVGTPFFPITLTADYSRSNLCYLKKTSPFLHQNNDYNYLFSNNDSIAFIGNWADNGFTEHWEDHCEDFRTELKFPFSYPNSFTDNYKRFFFDMSGSFDHHITGTNTVIADGYGTLITPDGITLNNVIRIHTITTSRDSNLLFGINYTTRHKYDWYASNKKGFILSLELNTENNNIIQSAFYQKQYNVNTAIVNIEKNKYDLIIYPNPFSSSTTLRTNYPLDGAILTIYNSVGQSIKQLINITGNTIKLERDELPGGLYFIQLSQDNNLIFKDKIIITN